MCQFMCDYFVSFFHLILDYCLYYNFECGIRGKIHDVNCNFHLALEHTVYFAMSLWVVFFLDCFLSQWLLGTIWNYRISLLSSAFLTIRITVEIALANYPGRGYG